MIMRDLYSPKHLDISFENYCEGCEYAKLFLDSSFCMDANTHTVLTCEHAKACERMYDKYIHHDLMSKDNTWGGRKNE